MADLEAVVVSVARLEDLAADSVVDLAAADLAVVVPVVVGKIKYRW